MITLSNGHSFEYMVASGALGFDGKGWFWDKPLIWLGLIRPELFTVVTKTLTRHSRKGDFKNPGIEWWCKKIGPKFNNGSRLVVVSILGTRQELVEMAQMLNGFNILAIEINASCPNLVIDDCIAVKKVSRHPIIIKLSIVKKERKFLG
jgi:dihydroorotate dehydrogenase